MLTHNQTVKLLAFCAAYDQRTNGEYDIQAWQMASGPGRWTYEAAQRVIVEHYSAGADRPRVTPAIITDVLRGVRVRAAESFEAPRIPDGLPNADYPAWLRGQLAAHCDTIVDRWASTGEEPPRGLPAPAKGPVDLPQLIARAPLPVRREIDAGVRRMATRRVPRDPARREQAIAELEAARRAAEDAS